MIKINFNTYLSFHACITCRNNPIFAPVLTTLSLTGPVFELLAETAAETGVRAFVIGGYIRDMLLNRPCKDIDVVVEGSGIDLANAIAKKIGSGVHVTVFKTYGTANLKFGDLDVEFVGARKESYQLDSRKPLVENGTLREDQERRDFTINALAVALNPLVNEVIDPFNGLDDLKNKVIKTPLEPDRTYSDDPLRMMRAIRFASQLGFEIEPESLAAISRNKERIRILYVTSKTPISAKMVPNPARP